MYLGKHCNPSGGKVIQGNTFPHMSKVTKLGSLVVRSEGHFHRNVKIQIALNGEAWRAGQRLDFPKVERHAIGSAGRENVAFGTEGHVGPEAFWSVRRYE